MDKNIFTKNTFLEMKKLLKKTKNKELGFALCKHKNKLTGGNTISGTDYGSNPKDSSCHSIGSRAGGFHTHPHDTHEPSFRDLHNAGLFGLTCIGGAKTKKISCFKCKWDINEETFKNRFKKDVENVPTVRIFRKVISEQDKLKIKYAKRKISQKEAISKNSKLERNAVTKMLKHFDRYDLDLED